jgi:hypothetical protein
VSEDGVSFFVLRLRTTCSISISQTPLIRPPAIKKPVAILHKSRSIGVGKEKFHAFSSVMQKPIINGALRSSQGRSV